jgi:hypothetical protein
MRKTLLVLFGVVLSVCAISTPAQVVGLIPFPQATYYWNATTSAWIACPNTSTLEPSQNTPIAIAQYGLNSTLNQWTPFTECPNSGGATLSFSSTFPILVNGTTGPVTSGNVLITCANSCNGNFPLQNVRNFGATGNGVTDDTAAIEAAQTFCDGAFPLNGCTLYFPTGIYIEDGLNVHQYEHWTGDGRGITTLKLKNNTTADALTIPNSGYNVTIDNLSVDGNSYGGGNGNCLTVASTPDVGDGTDYPATKIAQSGENTSKNSTIRSVALAYCNAAGLLVNSNNYGLHVEDLWVNWPNTYGIWDLGENHFYQDIYIQYALKSGILVNGANNMFVNTHSYWAGDGGGTSEGGIFEQGNRNIYTGVDIEDTYTNGFQNGGSDSTCSACTVDAGGYSAYEAGTVAVTNGSTTVTGLGTSWTSAENGWGLMVNGTTSAGTVTVNSNTSITLSTPWTGNTQPQGQLYRLQNTSLSSQAAVGFVFTGQRGNCTSCKLVNYRAGTYNNGYVNIYTVPGSNLQANLDIEAAPNTSTNSYPFNGNLLMSWGGGLRVLDNSINLPAFGGATSGNPCEPSISETISASAFISGSTEFSLWSVGHLPCPDSLAWTPPQTPGTYNGTPAFLIGQLGTATSGANFNSAELCTQGSAWTGSAANFPQWCWQTVEGTGSNPTHNLNISSIGTSGIPSITLGASTQVTGNLNVTGSITTSSCTGCGGGGGGGDSISSPNSTLNVGGTSTATTLDINLAHSNAFIAEQTVTANPAFQATDSADTLRTFGSLLHGVSGIDGISGSNSATISIESGVNIIERYNAYYNGTNDIFMSSGNTAWEVFLSTAGLQYHSSTNTPTPGATITWGASTTLTNLSAGNLSNGTTGTGAVVLATSPTITSPINLSSTDALAEVGFDLHGSSTNAGLSAGNNAVASLESGITSMLRANAYYNGTNDVFMNNSGPATEIYLDGSGLFYHASTNTPTAGATIAFGSAIPLNNLASTNLSDSSNLPRLNTNNAFSATQTAAGQFISNVGGSGTDSGFMAISALPAYGWYDTSNGTDQKVWDAAVSGAQLLFRTVNDASTAVNNWMIAQRGSGYTVNDVEFPVPVQLDSSLVNGGNTIIPAGVGPPVGASAGGVALPQLCTTGSFTPSSSVGGVVTATCTVAASRTGAFVGVSQSTGNTPGFYVLQGGILGTTVTVTATTLVTGTFSAITANVTVF